VDRGQIVGLVGESGSGKSLTAMAAMGLLPLIGGRVTAGRCALTGRTGRDDRAAAPRPARARIGFVTQNPMTALDPVQRIGDQVDVVSRLHLGLDRKAAGRARSTC
jgi:peptide/nickel transport system ATP-binding protein